MTDLHTAAQLALEALKMSAEGGPTKLKMDAAITALREALAEQPAQQESVAFALRHKNGLEFNSNYPMVKTLEEAEDLKRRHFGEVKIAALYTTPPAAQRQWVGLTPEEIDAVYRDMPPPVQHWQLAQAIEAKLKEKNA